MGNEVFIGNEKSLLVHDADCDAVFKMDPSNYVEFSDLHHALSTGFQECSYCLGGCYRNHYRLEEIKQQTRRESYSSCLSCGETRGVQRAHLIPRVNGGIDVMPLCPNCHWNYDHGLLSKEEHDKIISWVNNNKPSLLKEALVVYDSKRTTPTSD